MAVAVAPRRPRRATARAAAAAAAADGRPARPRRPANAAAQPPEPKARIPLDEVESIRFERTPALAARFVGQPNLDFTMPGLSQAERRIESRPDRSEATKPTEGRAERTKKPDAKKADGRRRPRPAARDDGAAEDRPRSSPSRTASATCTCPSPACGRADQAGHGQLPDRQGPDDLAARHHRLAGLAAGASAGRAPSRGPTCSWSRRRATAIEKDFTINVIYEDGQNANATGQGRRAHRPQARRSTRRPRRPPLDARVYLTGDEQLFGKLEGIGEDSLTLTTPWQDQLDVPLARVVGVHMGLPDHKESPESFAKRLKARGAEDLLLARTKDGEVVAIPGVVEGTEGDKLHFRYQEQDPDAAAEAGRGPGPGRAAGARSRPTRLPADVLAGRRRSSSRAAGRTSTPATWKVETAWGQELKLPAAEVQGVRFRGGPDDVPVGPRPEQGRGDPVLRPQAPLAPGRQPAGRAAQDGRPDLSSAAWPSTPGRVLTYDLDGRYATFEALVGFDDVGAEARGGSTAGSSPTARSSTPTPTSAPTPRRSSSRCRSRGPSSSGSSSTSAADQDTGDRVIWANARLYRAAPPEPAAADVGRPRADRTAEATNPNPASGE